jgi:hypothetical protein
MQIKAKWVNLEELGIANTERRCLLCTWHYTSNGVHEHCEEVEVKCMAKRPKHVFCQILHEVDTMVVHRGKT